MRSAQSESEQRLGELEQTREQVARLRGSLADVSDRLARGIEENESLYRRVRELEGRSSVPAVNGSIRDSRARSLDSLSDLTNIDFDLDTENVDKERFVVFFYFFSPSPPSPPPPPRIVGDHIVLRTSHDKK